MSVVSGPKVISDSMVLDIDANNQKSYIGTGASWKDLSGSGNNGTLVNSPTYNANGSINFDYNLTQHTSFANTNSLMFLGLAPYTLEAWIYPTIDPGPSNWTGVFNRESTAVGAVRDGYNMFIVQSSATQLLISTERFAAGTVVTAGEYVANTSILNTWHQVVATFDGSVVKFYRNGILKQTSASTSNNITNNIQTLQIALRGGQYFRGTISNARIYNRSLTNEEIIQNYNAIRGRFGI